MISSDVVIISLQLFDYCITFDSEVSMFLMTVCIVDLMPGSLGMGKKVGYREDSLCYLSLCTYCNLCYVPIL